MVFYRNVVSTITVALLPSLALGQSPDDLALGSHTRDDIEEMFRLQKGSLVLPSDGDVFDKAIYKSAWSAYARTGMQLSEFVTLAGEPPELCPTSTDLTILHIPKSGLYYQEIFVGNDDGIAGQVTAIVGISGNKIVGCNYEDITEPPEPLVPIGGDNNSLACTGPFLADLNDATCSYAQEGNSLAYDILTPIILGDPLSSRLIYSRKWVSFSDLDVFSATDPNGNAWPRWVLDNRDDFYDNGRLSHPCMKELKKKDKKWKKNKVKEIKAPKTPKERRRKRTSRSALIGI